MKRVVSMILFVSYVTVCLMQNVYADEQDSLRLYAKAAVLMDADSGRVLYDKNGDEELPMASTTKIMTCILALEYGKMDDVVTVSAYAAGMPKVHLGMYEGEQFVLEDLLYSLMLESHNDSAVAIAEHVAGSVEAFAALMNQKARDIGCKDTYFITPNGLDAEATTTDGETITHHTTARDLARIMRYCIMESAQKDAFLRITQTQSYAFTDVEGGAGFSCTNHNAFLTMMDGALSGKTGFTAQAGYCYVGALRRDETTLIVALLACGWPNNKTYKWSDTRALMEYGLEAYAYTDVFTMPALSPLQVVNGVNPDDPLSQSCTVEIALAADAGAQSVRVLMREDEEITVHVELADALQAPVSKGQSVGCVQYLLDGQIMQEFAIVAAEDVEEKTFLWSVVQVVRAITNAA